MKKLKKQVARNKISRFFKTYPLVLFFHTNNRNHFIHQFRDTLLADKLKKSAINSESVDKSTDTPFCSLRGKQNVLGRARETCNSEETQGSSKEGGQTARLVKNNLAIKAISLLFSGKKLNFLLKGPGFLLGVREISKLENEVDLPEKNRNLFLIGAIYENTILNPIQTRRLATLASNKSVFLSLISTCKNSYQNLNRLSTVQWNLLNSTLYSKTRVKQIFTHLLNTRSQVELRNT